MHQHESCGVWVQSWTPSPLYIISGCQCITPASCILRPVLNLDWWFISCMIMCMFVPFSPSSPLSTSPNSMHQCFFNAPALGSSFQRLNREEIKLWTDQSCLMKVEAAIEQPIFPTKISPGPGDFTRVNSQAFKTSLHIFTWSYSKFREDRTNVFYKTNSNYNAEPRRTEKGKL